MMAMKKMPMRLCEHVRVVKCLVKKRGEKKNAPNIN